MGGLGIVGLLCSCAVGPDYERPEAPMAESYRDARWKSATPSDRVPPGRWWEVFRDERLNELAMEAYRNNQTLKAAFANVKQARAVARQTFADLLPDVTSNPQFINFRQPARVAGITGDTTVAIEDWEMTVPFDLSYEIDIWGKVRRAFESATADAQAAAAQYNTVLLTLMADVAANYYNLRTIDSETEVLTKTLKTRKESLALVQSQVNAGAASDYELSQAQTEVATTESDLIGVQRDRTRFQNAISVLIGKPAPTFTLPYLPLQGLPPGIPPGMPSELLERRPDVAQAERLMAAANAQIGVAIGAFFPSITLTGRAGFTSDDLASLFDWSSRLWSYGPQISIPIFQGGRLKANLEQQRAAYEEAVANYRNQVLVAFQETQDSLSILKILSEQADALSRAVTAASRTAELAALRYKAGTVSYRDVVETERTALDQERLAVQVKGLRFVTTVQLIKALGGGWEGQPLFDETTAPAGYLEGTVGDPRDVKRYGAETSSEKNPDAGAGGRGSSASSKTNARSQLLRKNGR